MVRDVGERRFDPLKNHGFRGCFLVIFFVQTYRNTKYIYPKLRNNHENSNILRKNNQKSMEKKAFQKT